jgi:leucyl/phenylalanyl-tRNA--protein transferase
MKLFVEQSELAPELLLRAYRNGYFPMAESHVGPIAWYSPDPRAIIPLDGFKISRSLRQRIRRNTFEIRNDTAFERVILACANRDETWISEEIIKAYVALHRLGYAHSVEGWYEGELAGGLYGVSIGGAFFGESMFSTRPDASKVALVSLVQHLRERSFTLLDTQFMNEHLRQFGTREIPRKTYLSLLASALEIDTRFDAPPHTVA